MTIETILSRLTVPQAIRIKREHFGDNRLRLVRRCVTCDERWYLFVGVLRFGCRARRAAERVLNTYRPTEPLVDATAPVLSRWPAAVDAVPDAPPMRAACDPLLASWPRTGDGDTINTDVITDIRAAFGGNRRGPHTGLAAIDDTVANQVPVAV